MSEAPNRENVTGIVLAGGRSARFGADKLAERIDGTTVLELAIRAVAMVASEVVVAGQPVDALPAIADTRIRLHPDVDPFGGPLQALAGALAVTSTDVAVVVAGDMPSLVPSVLELLVQTLTSSSAAQAVVLGDPVDPSRRQPLPLALGVASAREAAAAAIGAGDRSLVRLLGRMSVVELPFERWTVLDPEARTLVDIDVPDDLRRVLDDAPDQRMR